MKLRSLSLALTLSVLSVAVGQSAWAQDISPLASRAVSFSKKRGFCRGSAPVPTPPTDDLLDIWQKDSQEQAGCLFHNNYGRGLLVISEIGAGTGAPPLQENETALPLTSPAKSSIATTENEVNLPASNAAQLSNSELTLTKDRASKNDYFTDDRSPQQIQSTTGSNSTQSEYEELSDRSPATDPPNLPTALIPKLSEISNPHTSVEQLLQPSVPSFRGTDDTVQISQSAVQQVTGVRLNPTASGLEVILETPSGQVLQAETRIEGKSAIADIENAQLTLPLGEEFSASNPDEGIASVTVTQLEGNRIRVSVTGVKAAPTSEVVKSARGLVLGVTPSALEEINITVTARQATPYIVPNTTTGTRTDTPLRDIPASIQAVPRQVLEERNVTRLNEALETVSGVTGTFDGGDVTAGGRVIRGFEQVRSLRNGLSQSNDIYALALVTS